VEERVEYPTAYIQHKQKPSLHLPYCSLVGIDQILTSELLMFICSQDQLQPRGLVGGNITVQYRFKVKETSIKEVPQRSIVTSQLFIGYIHAILLERQCNTKICYM
jgi:hypothetical protein